jgi:hypothetical protein
MNCCFNYLNFIKRKNGVSSRNDYVGIITKPEFIENDS